MITKYTLTFMIAVSFAMPASACIAFLGPCADDELPMSGDTFQVHAKGSGILFGTSPNPAVLQSAAQGCMRRGYSQFVIAGAQNGEVYNQSRFFNAWGDGAGGIYGNSFAPPPRQTTTAVIRCVRVGGIDARQYVNAND